MKKRDHKELSVILWDGGMGNELASRGASHSTDLWSARALLEAPEMVLQVHVDYINAGSSVITTNSYSTIPSYLSKEGLEDRYLELTSMAGQIARQAAEGSDRNIQVHGSIPPMSESFRPDLIPEETESLPVYQNMAAALEPYVDGFVCETMSSAEEARTAATAALGVAQKRQLPVYVAWTLNEVPGTGLRSGESVEQAFQAIAHLGLAGYLFNCTHPDAITSALEQLKRMTDKPIGGYANALFDVPTDWTLDDGTIKRSGTLSPAAYVVAVKRWLDEGASLIGGCCGIGPEHIRQLHAAFIK